MDDSTDQVPAEPSRHEVGEEQLAIDRLWDFADPAASEERFREAADDDAHSAHLRAAMATQLARAIGIQARFDEAFAVLDAIEAEAAPRGGAHAGTVDDDADAPDESGEPDAELAEVRARVALERGRLLAVSGRADEALPELTRAVRESVAAGSRFLALDALHMLALDDEGHEAEWADQGFALLARSRDPRVLRWGVALHHNLGWTHHEAGDAEHALAEFELAAETADRYGTAEQRFVARWSIGRALRTLGRVDDALAVQRALAAVRPDDRYVADEIALLEAALADASTSDAEAAEAADVAGARAAGDEPVEAEASDAAAGDASRPDEIAADETSGPAEGDVPRD
ncbi:hypothetical protein [Agromyces protaetiae]|uniref:hypothetical protein n=1 Tax=Agromyces protaetiae TaxID=2509455 RepID=UPI001AA0AAEB|nr:hypothetical protein [Agromyces protaetiae]